MKQRAIRTILIPATRLPVVAEADVVVVGGGNAGFVAAVASARAGARTVLIERYGYLGGALNGTYTTSPGFFGDSEGNQIIRGIGWEFIERMERTGRAVVNRDSWTVHIAPAAARWVALEMVLEAGVELYLHSWASEVLLEGDSLQGIVIQSKSGREIITGRVFVDATGDADIAYLAGAPTEQLDPDDLWQTSVDLLVCNVDAARVIAWAKEHADRVSWFSSPKNPDFTTLQPMISFLIHHEQNRDYDGDTVHVGPVPTVKLMVHSSLSRVQGSVEIDPTDVRGITYAEIEASRRALQHLDYLKQTVPGYENAVVIGEAPLGVRESRRIIGEVVITLEDLLKNTRYADVVALNCRALDRHMKGEVFKFELLMGNHDIPLRALIPQKVTNLLVAGRCISSDHQANASLRGAATCLATGHAAGVAAALAAQGNGGVRQVDLTKLHQLLRQQGAVLKTA